MLSCGSLNTSEKVTRYKMKMDTAWIDRNLFQLIADFRNTGVGPGRQFRNSYPNFQNWMSYLISKMANTPSLHSTQPQQTKSSYNYEETISTTYTVRSSFLELAWTEKETFYERTLLISKRAFYWCIFFETHFSHISYSLYWSSWRRLQAGLYKTLYKKA